MKLTLIAFAFLCIFSSFAHAQEMQNSGFEGDYINVAPTGDTQNKGAQISGAIAKSWEDNSAWADVDIRYTRETQNPHGGAACQRIEVMRVASGAQQFVQPVKLEKDHSYLFSVWLRGAPGKIVSVWLRKAGDPYTTYGQAVAVLTPEWKQFRVVANLNEDTDAFMMLRAAEPMTYWVDDAEFGNASTMVSDASPQKGNILAGGSFELQHPFGWNTRVNGSPAVEFRDPQPEQDFTNPAQGRASWKLNVENNVSLQAPVFNLNFNRPHTLSLWMRADGPDVGGYIGLPNTSLGHGFTLTTEWKRYTWTFTPPLITESLYRLNINFNKSQPNRHAWIDGIMLEESEHASTEFVLSAPVELGLFLSAPAHVVHPNDKSALDVQTIGILPQGAKLKLHVVEVDGRERALPDFKLSATKMPLPAMNNRSGVWKLRAQVVDANNKKLSAPVELVWMRLPRRKMVAAENSFFGLHVPFNARYFAIAKAAGAHQLRLHDTSMIAKWPFTETEISKFEFYDNAVNLARQNGFAILGMLDGAPPWTTTMPRTEPYFNTWNIPDKPEAMVQWRNYVRTVAKHYAGRIDRWEVWNEPWGKWWLSSGNPNATPELYAKFMQAADEEAHRANPRAQIFGVDTTEGFLDKWTRPVLKAAGTENYDIFSFHDYNDALYGGPPASNRAFILTQEQRMAQHEFGTIKPIVNTEGGTSSPASFYTPQAGGLPLAGQAAQAVRFNVSYMATGTRAFFLYAIHSDPAMGDIEWRVNEWDNSLKPALAARVVLQSLVDGSGVPIRSEPKNGVDMYTFPNGVRVLWAYDAATHQLSMARGLRALDVWGNTLTREKVVNVGIEPIYLVK